MRGLSWCAVSLCVAFAAAGSYDEVLKEDAPSASSSPPASVSATNGTRLGLWREKMLALVPSPGRLALSTLSGALPLRSRQPWHRAASATGVGG